MYHFFQKKIENKEEGREALHHSTSVFFFNTNNKLKKLEG